MLYNGFNLCYTHVMKLKKTAADLFVDRLVGVSKTARCLACGLRTVHHRGARNETLSCHDARMRHPRAKVVKRSLTTLLRWSKRAA